MRLAIIFAFAAASAHARCNATDPCRCSLTREGPGKEGAYGGCKRHIARRPGTVCFLAHPNACNASNVKPSRSFPDAKWRPCVPQQQWAPRAVSEK